MPEANIIVTNNHTTNALKALRTHFVQFDHASLVAAGRSRADGRDLMVIWRGASSVEGGNRALPTWIENPNTNVARVYWSLRQDLAALTTDSANYKLHFGNLDARNQAPIPVKHLSQYHPEFSFAESGIRVEPFYYFDDFQFRATAIDTDSYVAYTADEALSLLHWGYAGAPVVNAQELKLPSTLTNLLSVMGPSTPFPGPRRVKFEMYIPFGASAVNANGALFLGSVTPTVNLWAGSNAGFAAVNQFIIVSSGPPVTTNVVVITVPVNTWFEVTMGWENVTVTDPQHRVVTTMLGQKMSFVDVTGSVHPQFPGVFNNADGAGAGHFKFRNFRVERWDGIDDDEVDTALEVPALAWPSDACVAMPAQERVERLADVLPWPEYAATRGVVRVQEAPDVGGWDVSLQAMQPDVFYQILALHESLRSVGTFFWTNPQGVSERVCIRAINTNKETYGDYGMQITLEKDHL